MAYYESLDRKEQLYLHGFDLLLIADQKKPFV